jgi:hypothetical protein
MEFLPMIWHGRTAFFASLGLLAAIGTTRADITSTFDANGEGWSVVSFTDFSLNS